MWISYSDSEVNVFHPICEQALSSALQLLGKESVYQVIHHQYTGSLEMDFCIQNRKTGKYLCVVEVKRTPADVHSSRYQFQAMSYVQMNSGNNEKPFYILTNLEYAFAFRYDSQRPKAFQQILKPGFTHIGSFKESDKKEFKTKLTEYFRKILEQFVDNEYEYLVTLEEFASHMKQIKDSPKKWKSSLAILLYEYIRGAFNYVNRNELKDIRLFKLDVKNICDEACRINFKDIFSYSPEIFEDKITIKNSELTNMYEFGNQNITGDSIADLLHQIVSEGHEHEGEVPTDLELGRLIAVLAQKNCKTFSEKELICDPAAGSGNLISSAIDVFNLNPKQILVNDINPKLLELLSLRLGLNFTKTVCSNNSAKIENKNIADLDPHFFENVKVVVMNPPFVAGVNCVARKKPLFDKIKKLTGSEATSAIGQMPLEGVFLELVTLLVPEGTTIACVFPKAHLMARGAEARQIRKIITYNLGIHTIFVYPNNEIFDDVIKETCVLIGTVKRPSDAVTIISSYEKITDIDTDKFSHSLDKKLGDSFLPIMPGVVAKTISLENLKDSIAEGWRSLNSELVEAVNFVRDNLQASDHLVPLSTYDFPYKRGVAGNSGASDLIFLDSREELFTTFKNKAKLKLEPAMRNAKLNSFDIKSGDSKFLSLSKNELPLINEIINAYLNLPNRGGKQKRNEKDKQNLIKILEKEDRGRFPGNAVLIPRNIRRKGRIYLSISPTYVSTNFLVFNLPDKDKALILSTWMATIFYQVICEVSSKDQEGARKMEVGDILTTLVPNMSNISKDFIEKLKLEKNKIDFVDLQDPQIREIDKLWAKELFGERAVSILEDAQRILKFLANRRNT